VLIGQVKESAEGS